MTTVGILQKNLQRCARPIENALCCICADRDSISALEEIAFSSNTRVTCIEGKKKITGPGCIRIDNGKQMPVDREQIAAKNMGRILQQGCISGIDVNAGIRGQRKCANTSLPLTKTGNHLRLPVDEHTIRSIYMQ